MSQNLPAPCYQTYAANTLSNRAFRFSSLAVKGLIHIMQMECWINENLPSDPYKLAITLGVSEKEIVELLPDAMPFFKLDSKGENIYCPQLEDYRKHLLKIREKQKAGGSKGAKITNKIKNKQVDPQVDPQVSSVVQ